MRTRMLCINIRIVALLAALGLVPAVNAANIVWGGAAGECRLDDSAKWSNFVSWNDTANSWMIDRSITGPDCTATLDGDLTLPAKLTLRSTGPLTFGFGTHELTVPGLVFTTKSAPNYRQTLTMTSGTLTLNTTVATAATSDRRILVQKNADPEGFATFTGPGTIFNGDIFSCQHTGVDFTFADGATWNGTFDCIADSTILVTGHGTTMNGRNGTLGIGGKCDNYYAYTDLAKNPDHAPFCSNMTFKVFDGAQVTNVATIYVGQYGHHENLIVSNAVVDSPSCALKLGVEQRSTNNVLRILDHSVVNVGDFYVGVGGREQFAEIDGGSAVLTKGTSFVMGNQAVSHRNLLRIHGGATLTNRASNTYIGTANNISNRVEVFDGGEFYSSGTICISYNGSHGSGLEVYDRGRIIMPGTLCVGYSSKAANVPNELIIGANGTGTVGTVSFRGYDNRIVISNGTLNATTISSSSSTRCGLYLAGSTPKVVSTGKITLWDNSTHLGFAVPKEGYVEAPIQCGDELKLRDSTVLDLSVERGINGSYCLAKADGGVTASTAALTTSLIARWNEELKAQTKFRLKLELRENNTELWLSARTKLGFALIVR